MVMNEKNSYWILVTYIILLIFDTYSNDLTKSVLNFSLLLRITNIYIKVTRPYNKLLTFTKKTCINTLADRYYPLCGVSKLQKLGRSWHIHKLLYYSCGYDRNLSFHFVECIIKYQMPETNLFEVNKKDLEWLQIGCGKANNSIQPIFGALQGLSRWCLLSLSADWCVGV